ncbi:MAG TPA: toprim domain-containing protein [Allosphingosinicella sp.]|nr:toprim domain-containing protein [Allosphingosinicella sp.]
MSRLSEFASLDDEGRHLVEALGGRWTRAGGLCRCPAHADRRPSLSIRPGRARLLLHCFAGCAPADILRALAAGGLLTPGAAAAPDLAARTSSPDLGAAALRLWGASRLLNGTRGQAYLAGRGIKAGTDELRFHARVPHGPRPFTRFRPALVAAVRDNRGLVAVHRSFLAPREARLADLAEPRCGLGPFGRGAVRLGGVGTRLGLAEGIETALSASILFGVPCWATLGTERFAMLELPAGVAGLLLFLDHDAGGRRAEALARKAFGHALPIETHVPRRRGWDWNDVLMARRGARAARGRGGSG